MQYFRLFSNCIPVKGFKQSLIMDLQNNNFIKIPNLLIEVLQKLKNNNISNVKEFYKNENDSGIDTYLTYLVASNLGFYTDNPKNFTDLDLNWESPSQVSIAIINKAEKELNKDFLFDLQRLGVECLVIVFEKYSPNQKLQLANELKGITFNSLQLFIDEEIEEQEIYSLMDIFPALTQIYFFNSKKSEARIERNINIIKTKANISIIKMEPILNFSRDFFSVNIQLFLEAQKHNTYFNRKLYVGDKGEIKSSPESQIIFGDINSGYNFNSLSEIISGNEFQKYWYIHKGLIDVCKQCEYRYMCVDNRIPVQREEKEWFFKTECLYNPFIAKWKDEVDYKSLEECGITSNEKGFSINKVILRQI